MSENLANNLYVSVGGEKALQLLVDVFYRKILMDARVAHFFDKTDMPRLYKHQKMFMTMVLGGPDEYNGRSLGEAHRDLVQRHGLKEEHFDIVAGHLSAALMELGVEEDLRTQIMELVGSTKDEVLGR